MVLPVGGSPIPAGAVRVRAGVITAVAPQAALPPEPGETVLSLPECILLPGLVNAHCHLELGVAAGRVPYPGSFSGWVLQLMRQEAASPAAVEAAVLAGARALLAGGATCVGDITTTGWAYAPLARSGLRGISFRELLGHTPERAIAAEETARAWLQLPPAGRVHPGLSPHAPYSTAPCTYRAAAALARDAGVPLATHLSETQEEIEFLARGTGGLTALLRERGIPLAVWQPPRVSPTRYLADLGVLACRGPAAHVNYLLPGDLPLLSGGAQTPVYCPGSHRFFQHPPHPAGTLLRAGIPVALGTDSLASNERLDMLAEARLAWQSVAGTSARQWVEAATLSGARALGLEAVCGTLVPGKRADLIAVRPGQAAADAYAAVLSPGSRVCLAMVEGEILFQVS